MVHSTFIASIWSFSLIIGLACSLAVIENNSIENSNDAELPSTSTLKFVYAFFRHGIRGPESKPYPNDQNIAMYPQVFPGKPGKLTKAGKREMYNVGRALKARYGEFIGGYSEEKVHASSAAVSSRTTVTGLCILAGLFPPTEPIYTDLNWQPILVWQNVTEFDKVYLLEKPKLAQQYCPRYGKSLEAMFAEITKPDLTPEYKLIYELLQKYSGNPDLNCKSAVTRLYDSVEFEGLNGLPIPEWAKQPQPEYQNKPLYPDLIETLIIKHFYDIQYLHRNKEFLEFYSGPLLNNVHEKLQEVLHNSEEKFKLHTTHDTTIFALLAGMGFEVEAVIKPGDGVLIELHEENNNPTVQVFYVHGINHTIKHIEQPSCPPPCTLPDFIKASPSLTPQQWEKKCSL